MLILPGEVGETTYVYPLKNFLQGVIDLQSFFKKCIFITKGYVIPCILVFFSLFHFNFLKIHSVRIVWNFIHDTIIILMSTIYLQSILSISGFPLSSLLRAGQQGRQDHMCWIDPVFWVHQADALCATVSGGNGRPLQQLIRLMNHSCADALL
jgi:hypothetical protein